MGYDMSFVETPEFEAENYAKANAIFDEAIKLRNGLGDNAQDAYRAGVNKLIQEHPDRENDLIFGGVPPELADTPYGKAQQVVLDASKALDDAHTSYFRLNIWGMGACRQIMYRLGMVHEEDETKHNWPRAEDFGATQEDYEAVEYDVGEVSSEEGRKAVEKYRDALNALLSGHDPEQPGMALHKFCSNDGWLVTPEEIHSALEIYRSRSEEEVKDACQVDGQDYSVEGSWWHEWIEWIGLAASYGGFRVY